MQTEKEKPMSIATNNPVESEADQILMAAHERVDDALGELEDAIERLVELIELPVSAGILLNNTVANVRNALELV